MISSTSIFRHTHRVHGVAWHPAGSDISRVAPPNSFDGADSMRPAYSKPHGQTSLPVPPRTIRFCAKHVPRVDMLHRRSKTCLRKRKHGTRVEHSIKGTSGAMWQYHIVDAPTDYLDVVKSMPSCVVSCRFTHRPICCQMISRRRRMDLVQRALRNWQTSASSRKTSQ